MKMKTWISFLVLIVALMLTVGSALAVPTADPQVVETNEDTNVDITLTGGGNGTLTFDVATDPSNGTLSGTAPDLTYTPDADYFGTDSFTFTVNDEDVGTPVEATVNITVTEVNDAPVVSVADKTVFEDLSFTHEVTATDAEDDTLTIDENLSTVDGVAFTEIVWLSVDGFTLSGLLEETGSHEIKVVVTDSTDTATETGEDTFTLTVKPIFDIDLDENDISVEDITEFEVKVKYLYNEDVDNVEVTVEILDVDGDDLDENMDYRKIDEKNDDQRETFEFNLRGENVEEDEYEVRITVEGEGRDSNIDFKTVKTYTVDVDRENHRIIITKANANPTTLLCGDDLMGVQVSIENIGKSDENDVEIRVWNDVLGIDQRRTDIEVDEFSDRDNDYRTTFQVALDNWASGTQQLHVAVYLDGNLEDSREIQLSLPSCEPSGDSLTGGSVTGDPDANDLIQQLRDQLQQQIDAQKNQQTSVRESDSYVVLLATLTALLVIAVVLGLVILFVKRR